MALPCVPTDCNACPGNDARPDRPSPRRAWLLQAGGLTVIGGCRVAAGRALVVIALGIALYGLVAPRFGDPPAAAQEGSVPARPTGLTVTSVSHNFVELSWDDPVDPSITHYEVLRRDPAVHAVGEFETVDPGTGSNATSYRDGSVSPGRSYLYRVKAVNPHGSSEQSGYARAHTPAAPAIEESHAGNGVRQAPPGAESTDADLSALSLSAGTLAPAFDPARTSYTASVEHSQSRVTVTATASDAANATVEFLDGDDMTLVDADGNTEGHQVDLAVGDNTVKVKVTAEDNATIRTYTLVVTRAESDNTDLSDLKVNGVSVPGFSAHVSYGAVGVQYGVAPSVTRVTVEGVTADSNAGVEYSGADADGGTGGQQIDLLEGGNELTITVTAADGVTTRDYLVSVNRGTNAPFGWRAHDDFDTLRAGGTVLPQGMWSNGTTLWVTDDFDANDKLFAYVVATGLRDPDKDFDTLQAAGNESMRGIWSDGTTMWVVDWLDEKIYAYDLETRQRNSGKDFNSLQAAGNTSPASIWSDGMTMWVADWEDDKLYAYDLNTRQRDSRRDVDTLRAAGQTYPLGIWSDGTTIWVGDSFDEKLYAYDLASGKRDRGRDFDTLVAAGNRSLRGLWSDGATMWVSDRSEDKLFAYNMPGNADLTTLSISPGTLAPAFHRVETSYTASVVHSQSRVTLTATASDADDATIEFLDASDAALDDADGNTTGHQVDLATGENTIKVKVTAADNATTRTYTLVVTRAESDNTDLSDPQVNGVSVPGFSANASYSAVGVQYGVAPSVTRATIRGVTADSNATVTYSGTDADGGTGGHQIDLLEGANELTITVTAADGVTTRTYPVSINRGTDAPFGWRAQDDFDAPFAPGNGAPDGLWSDGTTMWVASEAESKIFAYVLDTGLRDPGNDFNGLMAAGNITPRGLWSNRTTMWVVDRIHEKIYAYQLATRQRDPDKDFTALAAAGNDDPGDIWSDGTTMWVADQDDKKLYAYQLATGQRDASKDFNTLASGNSYPEGIWSDGTTLWVGDEDDDKLYAYDLATGKRDSRMDFTTLRGADNIRFRGIWSNGTIMWVTDRVADKLFAYNMPGNADLSALSLSGGTLDPTFHRVETSYTASVVHLQPTITVTATASDADNATVEFLDASDAALDDADGNTDGHQVDLAVGDNTIKVKVTAADDATTRTYTLVVKRARSTSTKLNDLRIDGVSVPGFDADADYSTLGVQYGVGPSVTRVTVEATAAEANATVTYSGTDADDVADGHQLDLSVGANEMSITVRADGATTRRYKVSVNRGSDAPFGWKAQDDIDTLRAAGNRSPEGLWSDGTTMWVVEDLYPHDKLLAYTLDTGLRDPSKDFNGLPPAGNINARGLWSDGTTMWVADWLDEKIYAYVLSTWQRAPGKDFNGLTSAGNTQPRGLWSDDTTMWVVDEQDRKLYAYDLDTRQRDSDKDFTLALVNTSPQGVWSDGTTLWVGNHSSHKLYAYDLASGKRDRSRDFDTLFAAGTRGLSGIWSNGTIMWVVDRVADKLFAYNMPGNADLSALSLSAGTLDPAFHRVETSYRVSAPAFASRMTVTATASDAADATVEFLDGSDAALDDADGNTAGQQVDLAVGENTFKVKVTAGDGATTRTYTVVVTRAEPAPLSFESSSLSVPEGGSATVVLNLERAPGRQTVVPLEAVTAGGDAYPGVPQSVTFAATATSASFSFSAGTDDLVVEDDETVTVSFGALPEGVTAGSRSTTTVTIEDNDEPSWALSVAPASIAEASTSSSTVSVSSGGVTFTGAKTVNLTFAGTATRDADYSVAAETLTLAEGQTTVSATVVSALDDTVADAGERILITATLDGSRIGTQQVVAVVDDDEPATGIALSVAPSRVDEDGGATTLTVTGTLDGSPLTTATAVSLTLAAGTATVTDDYTVNASTATLTIPAAAPSGTARFTLTPADDQLDDDDETVTIGATTTSALTLSPSTLTVTIADNDEPNAAPVFNPQAVTRTLVENSAGGVALGAPVAATDADNDQLSYSLSGAGASSFTIHATTAQIRTAPGAAYDHETRNRYVLTVTADDSRGGVATATVTVSVSDVDEPPPVPAAPLVSPTRGSTESLDVSWTAPAAAGRPPVSGYELRYRAGGDAWAEWPHAGTGIVATISGLLAGSSYEVQVRAANDEGVSGWSASGMGTTLTEDALCLGGGPAPTEITVTSVPVVVASTPNVYFVLYVTHDLDGEEVWTPVSVTMGEAVRTTLAENVDALPASRYRVERYLVSDPADVDGDCIDDLTELAAMGSQNPLNPAPAIAVRDGGVAIPGREMFDALSFTDPNAEYQYVKFALLGMDGERPLLFFINSTTHLRHPIAFFLEEIGHTGPNRPWAIPGEIVYDPDLIASDGTRGVYYFWFIRYDGRYTPELLERAYAMLGAAMPLLGDDLPMYIPNRRLPGYRADLETLRASRIPLLFNEDIFANTEFLALNPETGYGRLRVMEQGERPNPRNVVVYEALPNELPRVAGIISTVPQTPLSHVNLRAVQDGVPNAFIKDALDKDEVDDLLDQFVRYEVTADGYELRGATPREVDAHFARSRPAHVQTPQRDLSVTTITPLSDITFDDWKAFGVKAANVAVLGTLGFPTGTVPEGFAIPFSFYDEFMKNTPLGEETVFGKGKGPDEDQFTLAADVKLIDAVKAILAHPRFQTDFEIQDEMLGDLRDAIEDAQSPQWIIDALTAMHATYPVGQSLRYRSSTNNEDLPGFSGAGLYDSNTQHPDETTEDGIDKSMKQVFASLWNFRAFAEREFHRIDHLATAMGVLVHPNYSDERANGVAVSFDPIRGYSDYYYLNTQLGEDLVTNPEAHSEPEEILLHRSGDFYEVLATSNQVDDPGTLLMSDEQMDQLADHLTVIHERFAQLYAGLPFAIEIEFKITVDNILAIKQARPWVFGGAATTTTGFGGIGLIGGGGGPSGPEPSDVEFEWNVTRDIEQLDSTHEKPSGSWSDGTTLWLLQNGSGADDAVYAYDLATGERLEEREFDLDDTNRAPRGVWSDGETAFWVSDSGQDKLFAHDLATGERTPARDIELADRNADPRGIWSDGETVWVLDGGKNGLFGYDLASGALLGECALDPANGDPRGLGSDGVTVWVSDHAAKRLFAYRLPQRGALGAEDKALERIRAEEFAELSGAGNNSPRGLWSDGAVMYVADESDGRVYTYNMPTAIDARLSSLALSGVEFGEFDPAVSEYTGVPDDGVTQTTVVAEPVQSGATVTTEPADADEAADGHQVALEGVAEVAVTVTSPDRSRERVYRVALADVAEEQVTGPSASCLRGAVSVGFNLVVYEGGSIEDLVACAEGRHVTALYSLHEGEYVSYILGAPEFVNRTFSRLFTAGVPVLTALTARSDGPPTAAPAAAAPPTGGAVDVEAWPACLRGEIAAGFSLVLYAGGSVDDLAACAGETGVSALYAVHEGMWVSYILGAPDFVNRGFSALFPDGLTAATPLVVRSETPPAGGRMATASSE